MGSRVNAVSISSTRVAPKAALSFNSASSGIRAPLTVDDSDFEYSASSKSRRNSTTSSYYSGSEPESEEGFASGEDEGILENTHYVGRYTFSRPFLKNPNGESKSYDDVLYRPSVKRPWREIVEEGGRDNGDVFGRALVRSPNDRSFKGFRKVNESLPSDSDEEMFGNGDYLLENDDLRPIVAAANEDVSENESSSVVDIEISLMPKSIIPIAQVSRDSDDDDSQASEVMDDDGFLGVARVPSIEGLQRLGSNRRVSILGLAGEEARSSLAENVADVEFVEELVVGTDGPSSKQEELTIDGVVSADMIQNKGLEDTCEVSAGSLVPHEGRKFLSESEWNVNLMLEDREFKEMDGVDERKIVCLDDHVLLADLAENTMLLGNFTCDETGAEPICPCEIVEPLKLEIPEIESNNYMVEIYVDSLVSDKDIQSGDLEQCKQKIDQTETRISLIHDQDVQISNGGLSEGCSRFSDLPDAFINEKRVNQDATHNEENSQIYGEAENSTTWANVDVMVDDMGEHGFDLSSGGEIMQEIDGQMATGLIEGVNSDHKFSDLTQMNDSTGLFGCFMGDIGVVSDGDMDQFTSVEAREGDAAPRTNIELEETLGEAQKQKLEIIQQIRLKYLQLLCSLGMFPENSVAAKVLCQLAAAETRSSSQEFNFDSGIKAAKELEVPSKIDLYFSVSILVIGKTGVGKSSTVNSIFGERKTAIDAFEPATTDVKEIVGMIDKVKVKIFDTPGLRPSLEDQSHNRKVLLSIKKIMQKSPPDVVLYVDRLDMQTINFDDLPLLKLVTTYLGSWIWQKAIISLTHSSSLLPDGSNGDPVSYEVFVSQRSYSVQQMIGHAVGGEFLGVNPGLMIPVALIENQTFAEKDEYGAKPMHIRESWRSHLLLFCYSVKILSEVNSMPGIQNPLDGRNLFGSKICSPVEDYSSEDKDTGSSGTVSVPLKDIGLPPSFDGNRPSFSSGPSSKFLGEQDLESRGWDYNLGYDGQFPRVISVQLTKDTEEFKIQLHPSVSAKRKHKRSTMAGLDIQTTGVSITFLEDEITVGERSIPGENAVSCQTQTNAALRASTEGSLRNWRGDVTWGCNLLSQFSTGRNSRLYVEVRAGRNKKPSWQVCIRTSSSDQSQIAVIALLPVAKAILRRFFPRIDKNSKLGAVNNDSRG